MPTYAGNPGFSAETLRTVEKDGFFVRDFTMPEHAGTHVDAPAHFAAGAATVDRISAEWLVGSAAVIDVKAAASENADYEVSVDDIHRWEQLHGVLTAEHIVLIRTGWSSRWSDPNRYRNPDADGVLHFPGVSLAASRRLAERGVRGLGIDTLSTDRGAASAFQQHRHFLGTGAYQIENLANLDALPESGATIIVASLPLPGGSGSPARVLALVP